MPERAQSGSVLALVPSAVLVLFLLGAFIVDAGATLLAQLQLSDAMAGAANDAATAALSDSAFYNGGQLLVDPSAAVSVVCQSVAVSLDARIHVTSLQMAIDGRWVHVRAVATVRHTILSSTPLFPRSTTIRAAAAAVALRGEADPAPTSLLAWNDISC